MRREKSFPHIKEIPEKIVIRYPSDGVRSAFWVDVKESGDSAYPYYITVSEKDPAYDGNAYTIMPLIDDSLPGFTPI